MGYTVNTEEQEVVINFGRNDEYATAYVTDRTWMTKFDHRVEENPKDYEVLKEHIVDGFVVGKTYRFPKKYITLRSKDRTVSEEQKQASAERFKRMWEERRMQTDECDVAEG